MFAAINLLDRFLTKMKVRPKHMACISVGSLHLAIKQLNIPQIDTDDLVVISQVSILYFMISIYFVRASIFAQPKYLFSPSITVKKVEKEQEKNGDY